MATRSVAVNLLLNPAGYTAGAAQVNRANAAMSASTTATATRATAATGAMTAGMQRTGASMGTVAAQAGLLRGGLTTPLVAAGAAVVGVTKAAIDWESSWAGVTKTVDGSAGQLERLEGDLRNMATELPATHGEIAKVAETAGQLGVSVDDVSAFTRVMVDLGETTNLSAEQAATSIARMTNIMGTSQSEVENLGSTLVDLGNNSATTEAEILTLGTRLAAAGNIAGLSEADVLAFAATLTSVGVEAEAGGTALSKTFTAVRDAVLDGGAALDTFAEIAGMTAEQFVTAFEEDPAQAIAAFIAGLGELNARGESTTAVFEELELTDQRLMRALLSTAEAGDLLTDSIGLASDAWEENNALSEEAQRRYDTVAASLARSRNQITDAAIDIGGFLAPTVEKLATDFATLVGWVQRAATEIEEFPSRIPGVDVDASEDIAIDNLFGIGPPILDWSSVPGPWHEAADAADDAAESMNRVDGELMQLMKNSLPEATAASGDFAEAQKHVSDLTLIAAESMAAYSDQLRAQTDPVFALFNAVQQVEDAQTAYNEAVDEYGKNSPEAISASVGIAEAVRNAEAAALNGELSFDDFDLALQRWVDQGVITKGEAENLREGVEALREESEDYSGAYKAQYETGRVAKSRSEVQGLINRAERWDRPYTAGLSTSGAAKAASEVQGLLNRAAAWRGTHTATFISNNIVRGSVGNLFAGRHQGGPIMHDGGPVNAGVTRMHDGGLRTDERVIVAQTGEFMMQRSAVDQFGLPFMQALNQGRAIPAGGVSGGGGAATMELHITGRGALYEQIHEGVRKGQVQLTANGRRVTVG